MRNRTCFLLASGFLLVVHLLTVSPPAQAVTAQDIHDGLVQEGTWVDWQNTVFDGFKANAQNRFQTVETVGVVWYPSLRAVQKAVDLGCDLLIFHEPLLYDEEAPIYPEEAGYQAKQALIQSSGMVFYRSHDFQDRLPQYGVHDQWKNFLGLTGPVVEDVQNYVSVSKETPRTVGAWAADIAVRSASLGQPRVRVVGATDTVVSRIAFGTGAVAWPQSVRGLVDADLLITTELHWVDDARWALETNYPLITVDHGVSEIPGVRSSMEWMRSRWPNLTWHFIENELEYQVISPSNSSMKTAER